MTSSRPSSVSTIPRTMDTLSRMWKNWDTFALSSLGALEFHLRKAARTNLDAGDASSRKSDSSHALPKGLHVQALAKPVLPELGLSDSDTAAGS